MTKGNYFPVIKHGNRRTEKNGYKYDIDFTIAG